MIKNTELYKRITSKTPIFFKNIQKIALTISAICTSIILFYNQLPITFADTISISLIKYITISGIVAAVISQLPVVNTNNIKDV